MKIIALIPARSGSKSIKNKNIKNYLGEPLLVHSIKIAKISEYISEIYVSTDSKEYQDIAIKNGAHAPFLRPKNISGDLSTDYECIDHFLNWYMNAKKNVPDLIIHLRPTYPNRSIKILNKAIELMQNNFEEYDSLRTIMPINKSGFKMYTVSNNTLHPFMNNCNIEEPHNLPRQSLPTTYMHNGYIDIIKSSTVLKQNSVSGKNILPFIMNSEEKFDIDTTDEWNLSEMSAKEKISKSNVLYW